MINSHAIARGERLRAEINALTDVFEAKHGKVETIDIIKQQPKPVSYNCQTISQTAAALIRRGVRQAALHKRVRQLLVVELDGVKVHRSAPEIARIMRNEGRQVTALAVEQAAARLGVALRAWE